MALPPLPLEKLLPDAGLVLLGRVAEIVEESDDDGPHSPDPMPGPLPAQGSQTVVVAVREVFKGQWPWISISAQKPVGPYRLQVQSSRYAPDDSGHLFLIKESREWADQARDLGGAHREILGLYGPTLYYPEPPLQECLRLLGHGDWPYCHNHSRRPAGYLEGMAWIVDPPAPWDFDNEDRPGREGMSLVLDTDGTCLLVVHIGDSIEDVVARFDDVQSADNYARALVDETYKAKHIAPTYGGTTTLRRLY